MNDLSNRKHSLQFFLCRHIKSLITVTSGLNDRPPELEPAKDIELALVPFYKQTNKLLRIHLQPVPDAGKLR